MLKTIAARMTEEFANGVPPEGPDRGGRGSLSRIAMDWRIRSERETVPGPEARSKMRSVVVGKFRQKVDL